MQKIDLQNIYGKQVTLEIVDKENKADFITHSGTFHADEVMSTVILLNKFGSIKLYRTNEVSNKDAFSFDVGLGKFDHHALDFDEKRINDIKYASCGLIWREFGKDILSKLKLDDIDSFFESIDKNLIMDIDRDDNGISLKNEPEIKLQTIPNLISSFNPNWDDEENEAYCFLNAVSFANIIFNNIISKMLAKKRAKEIIEDKINESCDGILILDKYMPWKDIVLSSINPKAKEILYAVFPSKRGGYNIVATPKEIGSFELRKPFCENWAGKSEECLQEITDVKTFSFCHKNLFICSCKTFDDALKIAKMSLK